MIPNSIYLKRIENAMSNIFMTKAQRTATKRNINTLEKRTIKALHNNIIDVNEYAQVMSWLNMCRMVLNNENN